MFQNTKGIYHLLFILSLIIFVVLKLPALSLPFYWDELGVYSRSSIYLAQHGLGLLPANLPPDYSRGHPLLFSFIYGLALKLFGISVTTGHAVSLAFSVALIITLYYILCRESEPFIALLSAILLMAQPVFFAQSVFVLPEVVLALFSIWALYAYYNKNLVVFAVVATMAVMVKETAIILPVIALGYMITIKIFAKREDAEITPKSLLLIFTPWLVFGIFMIAQKIQYGWFLFPLHVNNVSVGVDYINVQSHYVDRFLFYSQGRYWWVKVFIIGAVALLLKGKLRVQAGWFFLSLLFIAVFIAFSSVNFYMDRYMILALPVLCWLVVEALNIVWKNKVFISAISMLLFAAAIRDMETDGFNYDCDMSYRRVLDVEQQAARYACDSLADRTGIAINFPMNFILISDNTGFNTKCKIVAKDAGAGNAIKYIIYGSNSLDFTYNDWEYNEQVNFTNGFAWVKILKRKE